MIHQAGRGDSLAAGAISAEFMSGGKGLPEPRYDRRTKSQIEYMEKYVVDEEMYRHLGHIDENQGNSFDDFDWNSIRVRDGYLPDALRNMSKGEDPEKPLTVVDRRPTYEPDPLDSIEWNKDLIEGLAPHLFKIRYRDDRRFWEAVHKFCPLRLPGRANGRLVLTERVPELKHVLLGGTEDVARPVECLVLDVPEEIYHYEMVGNRVVIRHHSGTDIDLNGVTYTLVDESDILLILANDVHVADTNKR
jgi:hypothetical protein